ncbi:unnamed protein product, partial [Didymodactylos carnosus]
HPEKNMRLTKQLKPTVNSLKFASQIPNNEYMTTTTTTTESTANNNIDNIHHLSQIAMAKIPLIIQIDTVSNNTSNDENQKLTPEIKLQQDYEDVDSLNSSTLFDEKS